MKMKTKIIAAATRQRPRKPFQARWPAQSLANAVIDVVAPDSGRRCHDRVSGTTLPVAVDAIAPNDDFAWSAFANEIAFLNPDDLDGSTPVARIVVV